MPACKYQDTYVEADGQPNPALDMLRSDSEDEALRSAATEGAPHSY